MKDWLVFKLDGDSRSTFCIEGVNMCAAPIDRNFTWGITPGYGGALDHRYDFTTAVITTRGFDLLERYNIRTELPRR